jgi:hypothetical protein
MDLVFAIFYLFIEIVYHFQFCVVFLLDMLSYFLAFLA